MSSSGSGSVPGLGFGHSTTSIIISSLFALSSAFLAELINKVVPDPYLVSQDIPVDLLQAFSFSDVFALSISHSRTKSSTFLKPRLIVDLILNHGIQSSLPLPAYTYSRSPFIKS